MLMDDPLAYLRHPSEAWLRGQLRRNYAEALRLWWARRRLCWGGNELLT